MSVTIGNLGTFSLSGTLSGSCSISGSDSHSGAAGEWLEQAEVLGSIRLAVDRIADSFGRPDVYGRRHG